MVRKSHTPDKVALANSHSSFPDDIYYHLVDQISYFAGPETTKQNCIWQQNWYTKQYTFTGKDNDTKYVEEYSLYTFADGTVTEDGRGEESLEDFAFSYLAVSY